MRPVCSANAAVPAGTTLIPSNNPGRADPAQRPASHGRHASGVARSAADPRRLRARASRARAPATAAARRPVRRTSAGVARSPRTDPPGGTGAKSPETPRGMPRRRAKRAAARPVTGRRAATPSTTASAPSARAARERAPARARRPPRRPAARGLDEEREETVPALGGAQPQAQGRGPARETEILDQVGTDDPGRIAPGHDERAMHAVFAARRHPSDEDPRHVIRDDDAGRRGAALGLEPGGLAGPRDGPRRPGRRRLPPIRARAAARLRAA